MAKQQIARKAVDADKAVVLFTFNDANAETGKAATVVSIGLEGLDPAIVRRLALHGLSQKVGDSYSGAESVNDAIEDAREVIETLVGGKWSERTAGEPRTSALAAALERVMAQSGQPQSLEQCTEVVKNLSDEQRKGLRNMPAIKAAMSAIKAEKDAAAAAEKPLDLASIFGAPKAE